MWLSRSILVLIVVALCIPAEAQQAKKVPRIGYMTAGFPSSTSTKEVVEAFRQGLRERGYVEGQTSSLSTVMLREWLTGFRTLRPIWCNSRWTVAIAGRSNLDLKCSRARKQRKPTAWS